MKHPVKKQRGLGLVEVLITTVLVAVGLLSVASLQSKFVSSSGGSKARSEALVLAEQKLEQFRNNITKADYDAALIASVTPVSDPLNPIAGANASFTRNWTITDITLPVPPFTATDNKLKRISVSVGWDGNRDGDSTDPDEIVNVVSQIAWIDPTKAALYAGENAGGSTSVASPRQNASEDVAAENVMGTNLAITDLDLSTVGTAGVDATVSVTIPPASGSGGGTTVTLTRVAIGSHFYTATHAVFGTIEAGVIAVFLCSDADNNSATPDTCTHIQNHFGGVPHRIAGTVHSTSPNGFTSVRVAWTSSSINDCYNGPVTVVSGSGNNQYRYRPYECIYAGNCDATADNVNGCTYGVTDAQISARKVGPGGEYGDVGLLGVDDQGNAREQVCLLEDTVNPATSPLLAVSGSNVLNETYLYSVTKRFYAARRTKRNVVLSPSINDQKSEGINRSYTNHNFLVVSRGTGNSANQVCNLNAAAKSVALAPREIYKILDQNDSNTSLAEAAYSGAAGTAKTFTGSVTGSASNLKLIIPDQGNCYLNNNTDTTSAATAYACALPPGTTSVAIKGISNEYPALNPSVFASCTKTDANPCTWISNFTASAAQSNDCEAPWGASVSNGAYVTAYQNAIEPFGSTCSSELRTCTTGTLSGSYTNQSCTVTAAADCTAPWGATVTNGSSVTAYNTASVPAGFSCIAETRTCSNGILSGSGSFASCAVQTTRAITVTATSTGTGAISGINAAVGSTSTGTVTGCSGAICTVSVDWTGILSATGNCSGGGTLSGNSSFLEASATSATIAMGNCTGPVCITPWNTSVASGGSTTAYQAPSVVTPSTCSSETRYCNDGVLSGSYSNQTCTVNCTVPTINGLSTNRDADIADVNSLITDAGFVVGTATDIGHGQQQVSLQSPAAGTTSAACGSAISYSYN